MSLPLGLYHRERSQLDGAPIVTIFTGFRRPSSNKGTGPMVQSWILREDVDPRDAVRRGDDYSVCGDCPLRGRDCYVLTHEAPLAIWRAYHVGAYERLTPESEVWFDGASLRIGSYGDPAATDPALWYRLVRRAKCCTGYTHQWQTDPRLRGIVQASCDSESDYQWARSLGWGTFRILWPGDKRSREESPCRKAIGRGTGSTCARCAGSAHVTIPVHGRAARRKGVHV